MLKVKNTKMLKLRNTKMLKVAFYRPEFNSGSVDWNF